jgi:DNA-binding XRE family transcriptional regulator
MNDLNIHIRLKEARKFLDLNQLSIAEDLDILQKTISEIENGKLLNIPNKYIYYFYKKGISLEWIYSGSGLMMKSEQKATESEKTPDNTIETLFNMVEAKHELIKEVEKKEGRGNVESKMRIESNDTNRLLNSKDFNIKTLLSYVKSQEKMIEFLQQIVKKEMNL